MPDAIEFKPEDGIIPVSINVDTNLFGAFLLARLCQFAYEIDNSEDDEIMNIYSQIIDQIDQYGSYVTFDSTEEGND